MIDPSKRYRDAGASDELATVIAQAEQELIERFGSGLDEQRQRLDRKLEELSRAVLELQRVLCWPDEERLVPSWTGAMRAGNITDTRLAALEAKVADDVLDAGAVQLLALLRANGVTRYKRGDLEIEIELAPPPPAWGLGEAVREAGSPGCSRDGETPPSDPPDEQPAVEIDYAATEELLRAQDARRRGTG